MWCIDDCLSLPLLSHFCPKPTKHIKKIMCSEDEQQLQFAFLGDLQGSLLELFNL